MWAIGELAGLLHNITDPEYQNWPKVREILWALTRGGAKAMRNEGRVGALVPSYEADLILLDLKPQPGWNRSTGKFISALRPGMLG